MEDMNKCFAQDLGILSDGYCRQFGFLPLVKYLFPQNSGGGHIQGTAIVDWIVRVHVEACNSDQFNDQAVCIPVPSGVNRNNLCCYLVNYDLSILCE